jgi:hypothetical protein
VTQPAVIVTATPTISGTVVGIIIDATPAESQPIPTIVVPETVEVLTATPTRMLIEVATPVIVTEPSGLFPVRPGGLVDGPLPPTPVPIPVATVPPLGLPVAGAGGASGAPPAASPTQPITLDSNLQSLGVWVEPAVVAPGSDYWRLASVRWLNVAEAQGRNTIMLEVVGKNGQRVIGQPLTIAWKDGSTSVETNKPNPEIYAFDFPMNASGNAYNVWIDGAPSEILHGLGMGTIEEPLAATKTSFYVTFELVTRQ